MKQRLISTGVGLVALLTAQAFAQQADDADYREGYGLILEQNWSQAQQFFSEFQQDYPDSAWRDDAAFWNCYAMEQASPVEIGQFNCYQAFVGTHPESSWVSDAISKQIVLASQLASRGYPNLVTQIATPPNDFDFDFDGDFDFDFDIDPDFDIDIDEDELSRDIERSLARAEREMERMQIRMENMQMPQLPALPNLENMNVVVDVDDVRRTIREVQIVRDNQIVRARSRGRSSADDELLTILASLRDDERASEILLQRLDNSTNPELRARIVLLLEDVRSEAVTDKLLELTEDDNEQVRNNAILVLVDRGETTSRERLLEIAADPQYSVFVRAEIIGELDNWEGEQAIGTLSDILRNETEVALVAEAADAFADIGSPAAVNVLIESYQDIESAQIRYVILDELTNVETPEVLNFLSDIALNDTDNDSAAIAIDGIADREDNFAIAALEHIYLSTDSMQRKLAAVEGIGDAEMPRSVEVLEQFLVGETDTTLIARIVNALGDTEQESAVAIVLSAYENSDDATVRRAAIRALRSLDDYVSATDAMLRILEERLNEEPVQ
ncbi:MAG: HEAT repeat domain-containing protein [Gammaproteobacteria bacterium]